MSLKKYFVIGFSLLLMGTDFPGLLSWAGDQQEQKPIEHQVAVTVKLIQVYAMDKKGNPVPDLTKDDFVVTDSGRPVTLTEFEKHLLRAPPPAKEKIVMTAAAAPSPEILSRKFFFFFDFAFNNQRGVNKSKEAALHFIDTELRPDDEVGLLSYSTLNGLAIHEYLTTDHSKVRGAVVALNTKRIDGRAAGDIEEEYWRQATEGPTLGAFNVDPDHVNFFLKSSPTLNWRRQESKNMSENFILKLTSLAKALRYIPGQKQVLLFSTGIANCTIFTFDTREAALVPSLFTYDEQTFEERNRDIFYDQGIHQTATDQMKDNKITGQYSLRRLSVTSGGKYYSNIEKYKENLEQVQNLTGSYYVLGYYISEQWDGQYHPIKVDVKRKGCEVHAQMGYFNPKPYSEYSDLEKQLQLFDLTLSERPLFQTPLTFSVNGLSYAAGEEM